MDTVYHWTGLVVFWFIAYLLASGGASLVLKAIYEVTVPTLERRYLPHMLDDEDMSPIANELIDVACEFMPDTACMLLFGGLVYIIAALETFVHVPIFEFRRRRHLRTTVTSRAHP